MEEQVPQTVTDPFEGPASGKWPLWIGLSGVVILLCSAIFIGVLIFAGPDLVTQYLPESILPSSVLERTASSGNTMGDADAPIHIIEYGDFQCPYCLQFWRETEPQLIEEYVNTGVVYFEYRAFPIIGPESYTASEGAYCAGDQEKFWEFHDTLFTNWTGENVGDFTTEKLIQYAESLDLDMEQFETCLNDGKYRERVEEDKAQARADGVNATPTFIINGNLVEGAQPFEVLKHIIEEILDGDLNTVNG
jgi:protein-disulfide isomerase